VYSIKNNKWVVKPSKKNIKIDVDSVKEKYCEGNQARWSMDSLSFYQKEHELDFINMGKYDLVDFQDLPNEPEIDRVFTSKDGKLITMYKLSKICGTVIDRDKAKSLITLLTPGGVVLVKAYGVMPAYDKQISVVGEDGKKHVVEKSFFARGTKIIVLGIKKDENTFLAKKYKSSTTEHHFIKIVEVLENGDLVLQEGRSEVSNG
jgi:DNA polymerase-3 subunit alpha